MSGRPRALAGLACLAVLWLAAVSAAAHELRPGYLEITEVQAARYEVRFKVPARGPMRLGLRLRLPSFCSDVIPPHREKAGSAFLDRRLIVCLGGLAGSTVAVEGLEGTVTDVVARVALTGGHVQTARLTPDRPRFEIVRAPVWTDTARSYFLLGIEHILLGADHLLFVLALLLLVGGPAALLKTITAFTLAHSLTLAAAVLGWAEAPQAPVEALIALSIAFAAAEIPRAGSGRPGLIRRAPWLAAFAFGLLHGFGFGGALKEIGLPQTDIPLALLTFNLGVEAGQVLFVTAVLALGAALRRLGPASPVLSRPVLAYGIGCLAALWFFERAAAIP